MGTLYLWVEDRLLCPLEDKVECPRILLKGIIARKPVFIGIAGFFIFE